MSTGLSLAERKNRKSSPDHNMNFDRDVEEAVVEGNFRMRLLYEEDAESPRGWDNPSIMLCWHSRYNLGDYKIQKAEFPTPESFREWWEENHAHKKTSFLLPLYLYDHSGITISTGPFSCPWDSGQIGWIYSTRETRKACGVKDKNALEAMKQEVETYDEFITGQVYCWLIEERMDLFEKDGTPHGEDWEHVDSCGGIFGLDYARSEGLNALKTAIEGARV